MLSNYYGAYPALPKCGDKQQFCHLHVLPAYFTLPHCHQLTSHWSQLILTNSEYTSDSYCLLLQNSLTGLCTSKDFSLMMMYVQGKVTGDSF